MSSTGIMMYNRGSRMTVEALVALYSLRKYYDGKIAFYVQDYPKELEEALKYFNCDIIVSEENAHMKTLVKKSSLFENPPFDKTIWCDLDLTFVGGISELFDELDDCDFILTNFSNWTSNGKGMSKRINRFRGTSSDKHIEEALNNHPAINTGVVGLNRRNPEQLKKFMSHVTEMAHKAGGHIPDEVSMQIYYPVANEFGLTCKIVDPKYNVSVIYGDDIEDKRAIHGHGSKCVRQGCNSTIYFKQNLAEMIKDNIANINHFIKNYADKHIVKYLNGLNNNANSPKYLTSDVTIVTAADSYYIDLLRVVFPNWRKYKKIDDHPVIVFINAIELDDKKLDFLKLPNVTLIKWDMENVESQREKMLSAFVLGTAKYVKTEFWLKLDCDSFACDYKPLWDESFKKYSMVGHKWGYTKRGLWQGAIEYFKAHPFHQKLRNYANKPMEEHGHLDGNRFYHNIKRTISYAEFHKTKFSRYVVKIIGDKRLPKNCPSHDTLYYFIIQAFDPHLMATRNFKKDHGFRQGRGKSGAEVIKKQLEEIDRINDLKLIPNNNLSPTPPSIESLDSEDRDLLSDE
jgi:hypothetical protein